MPEYLAPGVYVEETSFRPKSIEGVSTSTAGFIGPARYGPTEGEPALLTSFADFERIYGGLEPLTYVDEGSGESDPGTNFLAHAVRAFFEEGGSRCYAVRVFGGAGTVDPASRALESSIPESLPEDVPEIKVGHAYKDDDAPLGMLTFAARFPGKAGNMRITLTPRLSDNLVAEDLPDNPGSVVMKRIRQHDTVYVSPAEEVSSLPAGSEDTGLYDVVRVGERLKLQDASGTQFEQSAFDANQVQLLTVGVTVERPIERPLQLEERYETILVLDGFTLHPEDARSLAQHFVQHPKSQRLYRTVPFALYYTPDAGGPVTGAEYAAALFGADAKQTYSATLEHGSDGPKPSASAYAGNDAIDDESGRKSGFPLLADLEDISIVAAPGISYGYIDGDATYQADVLTKQAHLILHCEEMKYRIAVLDSPDNAAVSGVRAYRGKIDSTYAALYYPWVTIFDPITRQELNLPPSGFVAGIYARNDVEHGVQKAPANEIVRLAVGFEFPINKAQQDVLNPEEVNCFRFFEGRGNRLWGARAATSDNEFKYVNIRRYLAYLERSLDLGTQVFVFESNGERLWANVRRTVEDFLFNEWTSNRLMGTSPDEAYFVKCDRSTMSQNDIDNGRLVCLVGVALLRPAEYVIIRIGQKLLEDTR